MLHRFEDAEVLIIVGTQIPKNPKDPLKTKFCDNCQRSPCILDLPHAPHMPMQRWFCVCPPTLPDL